MVLRTSLWSPSLCGGWLHLAAFHESVNFYHPRRNKQRQSSFFSSFLSRLSCRTWDIWLKSVSRKEERLSDKEKKKRTNGFDLKACKHDRSLSVDASLQKKLKCSHLSIESSRSGMERSRKLPTEASGEGLDWFTDFLLKRTKKRCPNTPPSIEVKADIDWRNSN